MTDPEHLFVDPILFPIDRILHLNKMLYRSVRDHSVKCMVPILWDVPIIHQMCVQTLILVPLDLLLGNGDAHRMSSTVPCSFQYPSVSATYIQDMASFPAFDLIQQPFCLVPLRILV